tara:strand:- start:478 stop:690 length:213 start_codon:yes stop_codon:yes gene_type:complete
MTRYKLLNNERIQLTTEEEAQRDAEEAQALIDKQNKEQAIADAETKKASGKQKLLDLGLSEDEVKAMIGI